MTVTYCACSHLDGGALAPTPTPTPTAIPHRLAVLVPGPVIPAQTMGPGTAARTRRSLKESFGARERLFMMASPTGRGRHHEQRDTRLSTTRHLQGRQGACAPGPPRPYPRRRAERPSHARE